MPIKCDTCTEPATILLSWGPENRQRGKFCQLHADDIRERLKYVGKVILTITPLYGTDGKIETKVEELEDLETPDLPPPIPINITTVIGENVKGFDTKGGLKSKSIPQENPLQEHEATYFRLKGKLNRRNWKKEIVPLTELWSALTFREKRIQELEEVINYLKEGIDTYRTAWAKKDEKKDWVGETYSVEGWESLIGQYVCGPRPDNLTPPEVKAAMEKGLQRKKDLDPAEIHTIVNAPRKWVDQDSGK